MATDVTLLSNFSWFSSISVTSFSMLPTSRAATLSTSTASTFSARLWSPWVGDMTIIGFRALISSRKSNYVINCQKDLRTQYVQMGEVFDKTTPRRLDTWCRFATIWSPSQTQLTRCFRISQLLLYTNESRSDPRAAHTISSQLEAATISRSGQLPRPKPLALP